MSYDIIGNIAVLKFEDKINLKNKRKTADNLMKKQKNIRTVVEKLDKIKGRLRLLKTRHLAGEKTTKTIHAESGCRFKLDIEKCYFSPRLAGERLKVAEKIKKNKSVLVLFAGVAPYSIIIAKKSNPKKVVSVELGRECSKYAKENARLNKVEDRVEIIQKDVKKLKFASFKKRNKTGWINQRFDYIVMPRPQLKETFLRYIWKFAKKNSVVFYYDFERDADKILSRIKEEAKKAKKKIKILKIEKAGEIAPFKYRFRADFKIL